MKTIRPAGLKACALVFSMLAFLNVSPAPAFAGHAGNPADFPSRLPRFTLADPTGKNFTPARNGGQPSVVIVTMPDMSQGGTQKKWVSALGSLPGNVNFYLIEDMRVMFASIALGDMKQDYVEGTKPVLLVDSQGTASDALKAPRGKTVVYVFDAQNRLVHVQIGQASSAAVANVNAALAGGGN